MPLQLVRNDITKMPVDAIVNAANETLLGGGGVDGAIHRAAGPELLEECRTLGGCPVGKAKITGGYRLPARYVIHTVGPVWHGGGFGEEGLLARCYRNSLLLAVQNNCGSVAFPLISAGVYGYPKDQALHVAISSISAFLTDHDLTVYLVLFGPDTVHLGRKLFPDLQEYIDDHYTALHGDSEEELSRRMQQAKYNASPSMAMPQADKAPAKKLFTKKKKTQEPALPAVCSEEAFHAPTAFGSAGLKDVVSHLDESFQQMLLRKIDESGMTDSQCYKRANMDRKLFSKIRSDVHYSPSKKTAVALAIALRLDLTDTSDLLRKAGFALSPSNVFDVIIEYFISRGRYNIFEINEALFAYDQVTLG